MQNNIEEILPIVDANGRLIRAERRSLCHSGNLELLHPVVHLHLFNSKGELLLQKRSSNKRIQPGKWDTAVGGHVSYGETVLEALKRESAEEVGYEDVETAKLIAKYVFESAVERELVNSFIVHVSDFYKPLISEPDQIEELRFWSIDDINSSLGKGFFTPNFELEYSNYLKNLR